MHQKFIRRLVPAMSAALIAFIPIQFVKAQTIEFADDFSQDSVKFSVGSFNNSSGSDYSITPTASGLGLATTSTDSNFSSVYIDIQDSASSVGMDMTHLSTSSASEGAFVSAVLETRLYSDNPESSSQNTDGTVSAEISFGYDQNEMPIASYCLLREDATGASAQLPNACGNIEGASFAMDEKASFDISLDTVSKQVNFTANGVSTAINITGDIYSPGYQFKRIRLFSQNAAASTEATLHAVRLDDETIDLANNPPVFDRYRTIGSSSAGPRSVEIVEERARLSATAAENSGNETSLWLESNGDYLESLVTVSSESVLNSSTSRVRMISRLVNFNDIQDGGTNGQEGDVEARIEFTISRNGRRAAHYCLVRSEDRDFNDAMGLLADGEHCLIFPLKIELDQAYRTAISLDRDAKTISYKVDEHQYVVAIESNIFEANSPRRYLRVDVNDDATGVIYVDDLRTSVDSVTSSESTAGTTQSTPFPDPIDPATLAVDSTVANVFDFSDNETQLDFVDDFSGISSDFGFWSGRDRGQSGISWDGGAIVFETNSAADNNDGNWTEFYLDPATDSIEAVVSLSSDTRLPVDADAEIQIRATFYNDTQDYGFNDREGDIDAALRIQIEGNGQRSLAAKLRRRNEDGGSSSVDEFGNGPDYAIPDFDQQYKLSLSIDRENGLLRFGVDDEVTEYQISGQAFLPSQRRVLISVNHNGSSGVAVGKIHSVKTDTINEDFSLAAPVIAPYRPTFNAQYPGRSVESVDGRLRLEADGTLTSGRDPRIVALRGSDYLSASIELSSDSVIQPDGTVLIGISGTMYNDLPDGVGDDTGNEGNVFVALRLTAEGSGERYVQTCAWRSNDADFDDATDLLSGSTETCARFPNVVPELDTAYPAFIKLDRNAATLTYGFNGETVVYNIVTSISNTAPFHGVRARASDGSKVVAWADDLSFSENPVALADSANTLAVDTSSTGTGGNSGGTGGSNSESSGGGAFGLSILWLLLLSTASVYRNKCSGIACVLTRRRQAVLPALGLGAIVLTSCATVSDPNTETPAYLDKSAVMAHISGKTFLVANH